MRRVLIYSADTYTGVLLQELLCDTDLCVVRTSTAEQAQVESRRGIYDVVIVADIEHLIDGTDLVANLRPKRLQRPLIFAVSWQHAENAVVGLLESGVNQYFTLPLSICRLRRKVIGSIEEE